eukprot:CAMPEP_0171140548 /NCGR_PEP_ID=MMETSP0766_2-20121228/138951_1 /TAXON_ID=439317 /ORGANISM="Gambierdiscus australes, Strain CAWD 149" /LENGTH=45 /DNA_ID= /DNA_START= /DNA_END= /DNA_ORIENTATION=
MPPGALTSSHGGSGGDTGLREACLPGDAAGAVCTGSTSVWQGLSG